MIENYPLVENNYTIEENSSEFINIEDSIMNKFFELIKELEQNKDIVVCTRGDSRTSNNKFFDVEYMKKFFVVGQKADVTKLKEPKNRNYLHTDVELKKDFINSLKILIDEINVIIKNKPNNHNIRGEIPLIVKEQLNSLEIEKLKKLKIIFISFLHNNGQKEFKSDSPFLSLTNGDTKFYKAKEFVLSKKNLKENGYIFLYSLNKKVFSSNYIITKDFIDFLKRLTINWYPDIHQEIMLLNGMYPHFILGIYQIINGEIKNFYMNPELYKLLKESLSFDKENGIPINQKKFTEFAKELGHESFFFYHGKGTFISDLNSNKIESTIDIKLGK
jgi:hypothetical protein